VRRRHPSRRQRRRLRRRSHRPGRRGRLEARRRRQGHPQRALGIPRELGRRLGADHVINPITENFAEKVLEYTGGLGAALYLEATGLPDKVIPQMEEAIWYGKFIGAKIVLVARAPINPPINCEVYEVKKAKIAGAQGHSGYGTFPRVISCMATGMDITPIITKKIGLDEVPDHVVLLQTDKTHCKITCVF
jgi:threonine dehydrogenase-like Zn-dependent dehydrogenase